MAGILTTRRFTVAASALAIALAGAGPARAWNAQGHATIANLAEARLSPTALAEVRRLLKTESGADATLLASIASWADRDDEGQRSEGPAHTVDVPVDGDIPADINCGNQECADAAVVRNLAILHDRVGHTDVERLRALKYVVHLVGDLHQPLHTTNPPGYNYVSVAGRVTSSVDPEVALIIHEIWDVDVIKDHGKTAGPLTTELQADGYVPDDGGTPRSWAIEGRTIAKASIFDIMVPCGVRATGQSCSFPPKELGAGYATSKWPIVARRLKEAGWRLARVLNDALG